MKHVSNLAAKSIGVGPNKTKVVKALGYEASQMIVRKLSRLCSIAAISLFFYIAGSIIVPDDSPLQYQDVWGVIIFLLCRPLVMTAGLWRGNLSTLVSWNLLDW